MTPKQPNVSGWRPDFQTADEQFRRQAVGLRSLTGLRITGAWTVWNLQHDQWFADLPVVIQLDDGRQLEVCWEKFDDLSVTWGTIDLAVTPKAWVEWPLEWRGAAHPALLACVGETIHSAQATTFRFATHNVDHPREVSEVWLTTGLWLATGSRGVHVFNAWTKTGSQMSDPNATVSTTGAPYEAPGFCRDLCAVQPGRGYRDAMVDTSAEWVPPTECDQCQHPISEHTIWPPDAICDGWMHCQATGCDRCWHDWPKRT